MSEREVPAWEAVGEEVVRLRNDLKMTQEQLSAAACVSISVIAEIERVIVRARRAPGTLERLSKALRCPPTYLDDILYGRRPPPAGDPAAPEQVLNSIREELRSLSGKLDALLAHYDIVWQPRQSSGAGVELQGYGHGHEPPASGESGLSAGADE